MSSIELIGDSTRVAISNVGMYSDNTPMIKAEGLTHDLHTMVLQPESLSMFMTGMFLVDSLHFQGIHIDNLVLPYLPGARQDRINPTGDILFSAWSVAHTINCRDFAKVVCVDPHSPEMPFYINNVIEWPLHDIYSRLWNGYTGIIAPDKGGRERAGMAANELDKPLVLGDKVRDVSTGRLTGFDVTVEKGGHYLVVDDICDGGGTFVGLGERIAEQGAFADLYVTHGIFSKGVEQLRKYYKNIYTTDSFSKNHEPGTMVIPVVERMIDYV